MYKLYVEDSEKKFKKTIIQRPSISEVDFFLLTYKQGLCYGNISYFLNSLREKEKDLPLSAGIFLQNNKKENIPVFVGAYEKAILTFALGSKQILGITDNAPLELDNDEDRLLIKWYDKIMEKLLSDPSNDLFVTAFHYGLFDKTLYGAITNYLKYARDKDYNYFYNKKCHELSKKIDSQILRYNVIRALLTATTMLNNQSVMETVPVQNPTPLRYSDNGEYVSFLHEDKEETFTLKEYQNCYHL